MSFIFNLIFFIFIYKQFLWIIFKIKLLWCKRNSNFSFVHLAVTRQNSYCLSKLNGKFNFLTSLCILCLCNHFCVYLKIFSYIQSRELKRTLHNDKKKYKCFTENIMDSEIFYRKKNFYCNLFFSVRTTDSL